MLPKKYRLKKKNAFNATYRLNNTIFYGGLIVFIGKEKSENCPTKVGFVVSKKVHKRAVKRNRLKRLMRESYRLMIKENQLYNSQNYLSLIFVGTQKALGKNFNDIKNNMKKILERV